MRPKFVAGNWKMYTTRQGAADLAAAVAKGVPAGTATRVAVCPPFPWLTIVADALRGSAVTLGAQNSYPVAEGAFTGEVSNAMLKDAGCTHVILGHSERRHTDGLKESNAVLNTKVRSALAAGLTVIYCVGELLAEREAGQTEDVLATQVRDGLMDVTDADMARVVVAYEPVWAIGTGKVATPEQAQEAHAFIRGRVAARFSRAVADDLVIQYGGSVKPDNAAGLLHLPDVDGALVGGASLKADQFLAIVAAAG